MYPSQPEWTCVDPKCNQTWPAHTTVSAFRKREVARKAHPDKECEPPDRTRKH